MIMKQLLNSLRLMVIDNDHKAAIELISTIDAEHTILADPLILALSDEFTAERTVVKIEALVYQLIREQLVNLKKDYATRQDSLTDRLKTLTEESKELDDILDLDTVSVALNKLTSTAVGKEFLAARLTNAIKRLSSNRDVQATAPEYLLAVTKAANAVNLEESAPVNFDHTVKVFDLAINESPLNRVVLPSVKAYITPASERPPQLPPIMATDLSVFELLETYVVAVTQLKLKTVKNNEVSMVELTKYNLTKLSDVALLRLDRLITEIEDDKIETDWLGLAVANTQQIIPFLEEMWYYYDALVHHERQIHLNATTMTRDYLNQLNDLVVGALPTR